MQWDPHPPSPPPTTSASLAFEERVQRTPYSLSAWLAYLSHLPPSPPLFILYERAVAALPGSYKLWRRYAQFALSYSLLFPPCHRARVAARSIALRAARALLRAPVLWADVVRASCREGEWTVAREALNEALRALPVLQHDTVWEEVLPWVRGEHEGLAPPYMWRVVLVRRWAKIRRAEGLEELYRVQLGGGEWDEAVVTLRDALADREWVPGGGKTREELWIELAKVAARKGREVVSVDVGELLRRAMKEGRTEGGELWVALGEYHIRRGLFEDARNVYEEAVGVVDKVRDFAVVFDAYAKFEEGLVAAAMEDVEVAKEEEEGEKAIKEAEEMVELYIARLEYLTERRPMLLSDVWLRQNPHNVHEWHKRARMFKSAKDAANVVDTYTKAVQTVNPWRATNGRPHTLWLAFAGYYEAASDLMSARRVLEKAVEDPELFRNTEDLAAVWCEYAEMELRCVGVEAARGVLKRAMTKPARAAREEARTRKGKSGGNVEAVMGAGAGNTMIKYQYDNSSPAWEWYKSPRVWNFVIDLWQSTTTPEEVIKVHQQMFELRIATPQTVLSGGMYLESKRLFEQAFRLYDRAASALSWPDALQIWMVYLTKFVKRFGSKKLERARDLFEEAIRSAPTTKRSGHAYPHDQLRLLYVMYANMEEQHSLARHALNVLDRAVKAVREEDRAEMYRLYIVKTATLVGVTKTRPIFEEALSALTDPKDVLEFAMRYAAMETRVGEIDRSRAIFGLTCEVADPRRSGMYAQFWEAWNDFELNYGSEDTFRDMLREKRNVQLNYKGVIMDEDELLKGGPEGQRSGIRGMVRDVKGSKEMADRAAGKNGRHEVNGENGEKGNSEKGNSEKGNSDKDNGDKNGNAEEIDIDLSDDDIEDEQTEETHGDANETPPSNGAAGASERHHEGVESETSGKLNIKKGGLPKALQMLVQAAHSTSQGDRYENELQSRNEARAIDVQEVSEDDKIEKVEKPMGALERFRRRK